jgi:hypothetical protein
VTRSKSTRRRVRSFFDSPMRASMVTAIVAIATAAAVPAIAYLHAPPGTATVTELMDAEAAAATTHDLAQVSRIYARDASVTDAGCQTPGAAQTWKGLAAIDARYTALPSFSSLLHVGAQVRWVPDDWRAGRADVMAQTIGVITPPASSQKPQSIVGNEQWIFARENGRWVITSFTYNLCISASNEG